MILVVSLYMKDMILYV